MASIAIGDVHGNLSALSDLLSQLEPIMNAEDTVVFLGDYIDRGPDTRRCVDRILEFRASTPAQVITLRGNHEDWLLKTMDDHTRHSWIIAMEALPTIASYSEAAAQQLDAAVKGAGASLYQAGTSLPYDLFFGEMPAAHVEFFRNLALIHRSKDGVFVHAGVDPKVLTLDEQSPFALLMGVFDFPAQYRGPDVIVYGHRNDTVVGQDGFPGPRMGPWTVGIDTIAHGVLTAVRLPDRMTWQSARYTLEESH